MMKELIGFLIRQNLVEERTIGKHTTLIAVTKRGITVLKNYIEIQQALPITEESRNEIALPY
jgi:predicted transcriptional regulator